MLIVSLPWFIPEFLFTINRCWAHALDSDYQYHDRSQGNGGNFFPKLHIEILLSKGLNESTDFPIAQMVSSS